MTEKRLEDMTDEEIASLDQSSDNTDHPSHVPDMVANDDGVISENETSNDH